MTPAFFFLGFVTTVYGVQLQTKTSLDPTSIVQTLLNTLMTRATSQISEEASAEQSQVDKDAEDSKDLLDEAESIAANARADAAEKERDQAMSDAEKQARAAAAKLDFATMFQTLQTSMDKLNTQIEDLASAVANFEASRQSVLADDEMRKALQISIEFPDDEHELTNEEKEKLKEEAEKEERKKKYDEAAGDVVELEMIDPDQVKVPIVTYAHQPELSPELLIREMNYALQKDPASLVTRTVSKDVGLSLESQRARARSIVETLEQRKHFFEEDAAAVKAKLAAAPA